MKRTTTQSADRDKIDFITDEAEKYLDKISLGMIRRKQTLAVAESVTSGFIQMLLSNAKNAQSFYQGGITAYNGAQKTKHLQIEPIYAADCNCVSQDIATEMAKNVCDLFCSEVGVAITGYATPVPEEEISTIFAYIAIVRRGEVLFHGKIAPGNKSLCGIDAQRNYALQVVKKMATLLK